MWPSIRRKVTPSCNEMGKMSEKDESKLKRKRSSTRKSSSSSSSSSRTSSCSSSSREKQVSPCDDVSKEASSANASSAEKRSKLDERNKRKRPKMAVELPSKKSSKSSSTSSYSSKTDKSKSSEKLASKEEDDDEKSIVKERSPIIDEDEDDDDTTLLALMPNAASIKKEHETSEKGVKNDDDVDEPDDHDDVIVKKEDEGADKSQVTPTTSPDIAELDENSRSSSVLSGGGGGGGGSGGRKSRSGPSQPESDSCNASVTSGDGRATSSNTTNRGRNFPRINFRIGEKIEARDCFNMWYPSKIIQVDWDDKEVLIHFERWNSRFDEWVAMDSPRLRAATRTSSRKESKEKTERSHTAAKGFRVGEVILAKWIDCKMYPAKILKIHSDISYNVRFYDGFERIVQPINVKKLPSDMVGQVNFKSPPPPPPATSAQQSGGDKKRNVSGGSKGSESVGSKSSDGKIKTSTPVKGKDVSTERAKHSTPVKSEHSKNSGASKSKTPSMSSSTVSQKSGGSGGSASTSSSSTSKKRKLVIGGIFQAKRHTGETKTTTTTTIVKQPKQSPPTTTMTPIRPKTMKLSENVKRDLLTVVKEEAAQKSVEIISDVEQSPDVKPLHAPDDTMLSPAVMNVDPSLPIAVPPKAFVIEEDHNHFKCPTEGCGKAFRKASLLSSHLKHYHSPRSEMLAAAAAAAPSRNRRSSETLVKQQVIKTAVSSQLAPATLAPMIVASKAQRQQSPQKQSTSSQQAAKSTKQTTPTKQQKLPPAETIIDDPPTCTSDVKTSKEQILDQHLPSVAIMPEANMDRKKITEKRRQLLLQRRLEGIYKKRQQAAMIEKSRLAMLEKSRQQRRARLARVIEVPAQPPGGSSQLDADDVGNPAQLMVEAIYEEPNADEAIELKIGGGIKRKLLETVDTTGPAVDSKPEVETTTTTSSSSSIVEPPTTTAMTVTRSALKRSKRSRRARNADESKRYTRSRPSNVIKEGNDQLMTSTVKPEVPAIDSKQPLMTNSKRVVKPVKRIYDDDDDDDDESTTSAMSDTGGSAAAAETSKSEDQQMLDRLTREFNQFTKSRQSVRKARAARGRRDKSREEVVNCRCEEQEEEGLMMQCEVCLAWQHGACFDIEDENKVPDKYVCFACEAPRGQRRSFRYRHHQDWFKRGSLATFKFLPRQEDNWELKGNMLRTHNLASQMFAVNQVLHSLRRKLQVVKDQDPSDLEFWSSPWIDTTPEEEQMATKQETPPVEPTGNQVTVDDSFTFSDHSYSNLNVNHNSSNNRTHSDSIAAAVLLDTSLDEPEIEGVQITVSTSDVVDQSEKTTTTTTMMTSSSSSSSSKVENKDDDDSILEIPIEPRLASSHMANGHDDAQKETLRESNDGIPQPDQADVEIATSQQTEPEKIMKTNEKIGLERTAVQSTEPLNKLRTPVTKEFDVYECQLNVLDHIEQLQEELDKRMDELSEQLEELESYYESPPPLASNNNNSANDSSPDMFRSKRLLKGMMTDLNKVRRMSLYC